MQDLGTVLEMAQAVNTIGRLNKEVGTMVNEAGSKNSHNSNHNGNGKGFPGATRVIARGKAGAEPDADFSDMYEESPRRNRSADKAPQCYQAAMEYMAELARLHSRVDYHARLQGSKALQLLEQAKQAAHTATQHGLLSIFRGILPEPTPALETLVGREIEVMAAMQKQVGMAVHHSESIVGKLRAYDRELLTEFDCAKTELAQDEKKLARIQSGATATAGQLQKTPMDDQGYVPLQMKLNNLSRAEMETKNKLEMTGQQVVDTYKQSSQVRAKEDVVRMGLHELRLVNSYVTRFLTFVQRTRDAEALLPKLVETAGAVTSAYQVLTGIVTTGSVATTQAVESLAEAIGSVDYRVLPTVQREVNMQRAVLERADKKTTFYEQAVELLRGKNYRPASAGVEGQSAAASPAA